MAKDRRNREKEQQTRLGPEEKTRSARKKKNSPAKIIVMSLLGAVLLVAVVFLVILGQYLLELFSSDEGDSTPIIQHQTTADAYKNKVGYYLFGLLGSEIGDDTQSLALICHDKAEKNVDILQFPQDTYLGNDGTFAVKHVGGVWSNPKPLTWCETCRKRVYEPEMADGKHSVCQTALTEKTGSSVENLIDVFNDQYSMPVDGYFLFPEKAMIKLVDALGGVTVDVDKKFTLDDVTYKSGVRTLDGAAAVYYMTYGKKDVSTDLARMERQRQVYTALLSRLMNGDKEEVQDALSTVMNGSTPIRTDVAVKDMMTILGAFSEASLSRMTVYTAPGEAVKSGSATYYSLHAAKLLELLNAEFNPYGLTISETDLKAVELKEPSKKSNTDEQTLSELFVEQAKPQESK